jgi:hypothetical protein
MNIKEILENAWTWIKRAAAVVISVILLRKFWPKPAQEPITPDQIHTEPIGGDPDEAAAADDLLQRLGGDDD